MGRPKLSLPLGDRTVLERVIAALRDGGVARIVVVVGPHVPELVPLAQTSGADVCLLDRETPDMRATVERGLAWLERTLQPRPDDFWLLVPADHPTLDPALVRRLLTEPSRHPTASIFVPTFAGKRGHPTLIAWRHIAGIRALPSDRGLNTYLRQHGDETHEMPVDLADVLLDLDTPEAYAAVKRRFTEQ